MHWQPWNQPRTISLALQGGGAHGAFTWGVLDALLAQPGLRITALSGASAGAMNAVVLAHGLAEGGADGARDALRRFWTAVGTELPFEWVTVGRPEAPGLAPVAKAAVRWSHFLSPYQFNPLGLDPMRRIVGGQVDFARLRHASPVHLFIATTQAATGRLRVFRETELHVDALLASACLPSLSHSVMIDGEPHWDGAYSANPPLWPLIADTASEDLVLVQLSPQSGAAPPRSADQIRHRAVELAFNAPFLREGQWLADWRGRPAGLLASPLERRLRRQRFHRVDGRPGLAALAGETRLIAHLPFLEHLRDLGHAEGAAWLARHEGDIGRRSSLDIADLSNLAKSGPA